MTVKTRAVLKSDAVTLLADNLTGDISAADVRQRVEDLADSAVIIMDDLGLVINAADYGLRASATAAVNTAALNDASTALRAAISGAGVTSEQYIGAKVHVPPGVYNVAAGAGNVGWDLTLIRSGLVRFDCAGAVFLADATLAGKTVIDCIGSRFFTGVLPEVRAFVKATPPAIGLQFGRHSDLISCGEHQFNNLHIRGYFTRAAVYNSNAEACVFDNPIIFNYQATSTSYAWIQDGRNVWMPITDVSLAGLTQDLAKAYNLNTFVGGVFRKLGYDIDTNTYIAAVGSPVYMTRCLNHKFLDSYFVSDEESGVVMASDAAGFVNVRFHQCHFESALDHAIKMIVVSGTAWIGKGIQLEVANSNADVSLFDIDAGVSTVNIHDLDLSVRVWSTAPSSNIFNSPAKVTLTGARVSLPDLTHWVAVASFQGDIITPAAWTHRGLVDFTTAPTVNTKTVHHKGDGLQQQVITLADNAAVAVTLPANCGAHFILAISSASGFAKAALFWGTPSGNLIEIIAQISTQWEVLNGTVLTGTTGTDAKVTLGITAGVLYLENRSGVTINFSLTFMANR